MDHLTREQLKASLSLSVGTYATDGEDPDVWGLVWDGERSQLCITDEDTYEIACNLSEDQIRGLHAALTLKLLELNPL